MNNSGDVGWTPIYLAIIVAIAVILMIAVIKPMFQGGAQYAETQLPSFLHLLLS